MRMTSQRALILEHLKNVKSHPTAAEVYTVARRRLPNISFGTVYRNLGFLRKQGLLQELKFEGISHFDGNTRYHYHFLCRICGKVEDIEMAPLDSLTDRAQKMTDSEIEFHQIQFVGRCHQCKQKEMGGKNGNRGKS